MAYQGETKWIKSKKITKGEIISEIGDIDSCQGSYAKNLLLGFAGLIAGGFLGTAVGGYGIVSLIIDTFYDKQRDELVAILTALKGKPDSTEIEILMQYRFTEKDGGNWMPTYELSYTLA